MPVMVVILVVVVYPTFGLMINDRFVIELRLFVTMLEEPSFSDVLSRYLDRLC